VTDQRRAGGSCSPGCQAGGAEPGRRASRGRGRARCRGRGLFPATSTRPGGQPPRRGRSEEGQDGLAKPSSEDSSTGGEQAPDPRRRPAPVAVLPGPGVTGEDQPGRPGRRWPAVRAPRPGPPGCPARPPVRQGLDVARATQSTFSRGIPAGCMPEAVPGPGVLAPWPARPQPGRASRGRFSSGLLASCRCGPPGFLDARKLAERPGSSGRSGR